MTSCREGRAISPKQKLAIVATAAVISLLVVVVGLASLAPKSKPQSVNELPVANFAFDADNLTVEFDASASSDPDGTIANYSWSFGDETVGYGATATHEFADNGTYVVGLSVTDDKGGKNASKKNVSVSMTIEPAASGPEAEIEIMSQDDWTVVLSGAGSSVRENGEIVSYVWDFGDGTYGTGEVVTHTYAANGTYVVTLTVTDDNDATDSASVSVTVTKPWVPPEDPPENKTGPPGLLRAIENHEERLDSNPHLQNSLDHLIENLDRWLEKHSDSR